MTARRLETGMLKKFGIELDHRNFVVGIRAFQWDFKIYQPGAPIPEAIPPHKIRQLYESRRIEIAPERAKEIGVPERFVAGSITRLARAIQNAGHKLNSILAPLVTPVAPVAMPSVSGSGEVAIAGAPNVFDTELGIPATVEDPELNPVSPARAIAAKATTNAPKNGSKKNNRR